MTDHVQTVVTTSSDDCCSVKDRHKHVLIFIDATHLHGPHLNHLPSDLAFGGTRLSVPVTLHLEHKDCSHGLLVSFFCVLLATCIGCTQLSFVAASSVVTKATSHDWCSHVPATAIDGAAKSMAEPATFAVYVLEHVHDARIK